MRYFFVLAAALFLGACATVPGDAPSFSEAPQAENGKGLLYIYRVGAYPTKRVPKILIDGKVLFAPPELAYTWVHLPAGKHQMTVNWAWDTGWPDLNFDIEVSSEEPTFLKLSGSFENLWTHHIAGSRAEEVSVTVALRELKECCRYISPISSF